MGLTAKSPAPDWPFPRCPDQSLDAALGLRVAAAFSCLTPYPQLQRDATVTEALQPPLEMAIAIYRFARGQFHATPGKALVVRGTKQFAVQPGRGNFQQVRASRNRILHIQDGTHFPAEVGAILVRDPTRLVNGDAQHATAATTTKFNFDDLQPAGGCYPLCNLAHFLVLKCHCANNLQPAASTCDSPKLKSGLSPTGVLRQMLVLHNSFQINNIRRLSPKDKRGGSCNCMFSFLSVSLNSCHSEGGLALRNLGLAAGIIL